MVLDSEGGAERNSEPNSSVDDSPFSELTRKTENTLKAAVRIARRTRAAARIACKAVTGPWVAE